MKTLTPVPVQFSTRLMAVLCLSLGLVVVAAPVSAEPLDLYTGYTRPGTERKAPPEKGVAPAAEGVEAELGMTIYYKVYRVQDILHSDVATTGIKNIDEAFVPGKDPGGNNNSPKFDSKARYLYLYQVVNDSGRNGIGRSVSVQLIVPPDRITSWGHFVMRPEKAPARGLSFATDVADKARKGRTEIWTVSADHNPVKEDQRAYANPAPYYPRTDLSYDLQPILIGNIVGAGPEAEAVGREPNRVMIVADPTFKPRTLVQPNLEDFNNPQQLGGAVAPAGPGFGPAGPGFAPATTFVPGGWQFVNPFEYRMQEQPELEPSNLVFRAFFEDPLRANQRSTVFGFTSDLPPIYTPVRIRGTSQDKLQAAGPGGVDPRSDSLIADGGVPSPAGPAADPAGGAPSGGSFGGVGGVSGPGGGGLGGGTGGGVGGLGGGTGGGGFEGGGGGTTGGGGGTTTNPNQQQQQQQTPTTTPTSVIINNEALAIAQQAQQQQQQQKQKQKQSQQQDGNHHHAPHQVVPEPAAAFSALLGLPLIWLLSRRLGRRQPAMAHASVG